MAEALAAWHAGHAGVALDLWAPLAHEGNARAQSNMGAAFLEGRGVERDPNKAVLWLRKLGGKLGLKSDRDGPYILLRGLSAVWQSATTLSWLAIQPFPRHLFGAT